MTVQKSQVEPIVGFLRHDHSRCVARALEEADSFCRQNKLRFTAVRRRTLTILLESHNAMAAYDLLDRLQAEGFGSKPPIVYRALGFLLDNGFIHRVETLNAFIACSHPGAEHDPAFLICTQCRAVAETPVNSTGSLSRSAREVGFRIERTTLEAAGQCQRCRQQGAGN